MGHLCVSHYRRMNRTTVFSHEELVCKMAANPDNLDLNLAKAIYEDMVSMVEQESKLQQELKDKVRLCCTVIFMSILWMLCRAYVDIYKNIL